MKKLLFLFFIVLGPGACVPAAAQTGIAAFGDASTVNDGDIFYDVQGFTGANVGTDKYVTALQLGTYFDQWLKITGKPTTLSGYGITDAGNGYQAESVSAASSTTLSSLGRISFDTITLGAGSGAYAVARALSDSGARAGDEWFVNVLWPSSTNPTLSFTDATSGASLGTYASTTAAGSSTLQFVFNGTAWVHYSKGELDTRNLGSGVQTALGNATGTASGFSTQSQTDTRYAQLGAANTLTGNQYIQKISPLLQLSDTGTGGHIYSLNSASGTFTLYDTTAMEPDWAVSSTGNMSLYGTHNTAPNQKGVVPGDTDLVNFNQAILAALTRTTPDLLIAYWGVSTGSGGVASINANSNGVNAGVGTSTTSGSYGYVQCQFPAGVFSPTAQGQGYGIDFSKTIWFSSIVNLRANGACPNTTLRGFLANVGSGSGISTAPNGPSIGWKLVFSTTNTATLYGEAYTGSTLITGVALTTLSGVGPTGYTHTITVVSTAGSLNFIVDGTNVGSMGTGPSALTTGNPTLEYLAINGGDATAVTSYIFTPSLFVEN